MALSIIRQHPSKVFTIADESGDLLEDEFGNVLHFETFEDAEEYIEEVTEE